MRLPQQVSQSWRDLAPREKLLAAGAGAVVVLALLWWVAVSPALSVLKTSDAQHATLDAQLARMQALQQQARTLQTQPKQSREESLRALEAAVRQRLGATARTTAAGDRVTVTLAGTSPDALASWLADARANAHALPAEARLTRGASGGWDGTLVLTLPGR
jgi:general secretion pathway protein M